MSAESLPTYHVKARNTSQNSENAIHDDVVARRYGFAGGLVPGVTVYAYMTHAIVEAFGPAWIARGTASVRFGKPVLDGEEVTISATLVDRGPTGATASVIASTPTSGECASATVTLPAGMPVPVNLARYETAALPTERPAATREHLAGVRALGTPVCAYDDGAARAWLEKIADELPLYRGPRALVHPSFYLDQANRALDRNVRMGPWIHVGSSIRHLGTASVGETLVTRGRVRSLFEKRGREFVELDLAITAGEPARTIAHVLHTAIYRLPPA